MEPKNSCGWCSCRNFESVWNGILGQKVVKNCVEKPLYLQESGEEEEDNERNKERKGKEVECEWEVKKC